MKDVWFGCFVATITMLLTVAVLDKVNPLRNDNRAGRVEGGPSVIRIEDEGGDPAPGFVLVTNSVGEWFGMYARTKVVIGDFPGQRHDRRGAVERTWSQYRFEESEKAKRFYEAK